MGYTWNARTVNGSGVPYTKKKEKKKETDGREEERGQTTLILEFEFLKYVGLKSNCWNVDRLLLYVFTVKILEVGGS